MTQDVLYQEARKRLWEHMCTDHNSYLLESECFELWIAATESCRKEIVRLEKLVAFHVRGRMGIEETNEAVLKVLNP